MPRKVPNKTTQGDLFDSHESRDAKHAVMIHTESLQDVKEPKAKGLRVGPERMISISELKENPANNIFEEAKTPEYWNQLRADIVAIGSILSPLIVTNDYVIIEGHSRLRIARELVTEGNELFEMLPVRIIHGELSAQQQEERLILGNLLRFEIDDNLRILLHARLYPEFFRNDSRGRPPAGSSTPKLDEVADRTKLSASTLKRESKVFRTALAIARKDSRVEPNLDDIRRAREADRKASRQRAKASSASGKRSDSSQTFVDRLQALVNRFQEMRPDEYDEPVLKNLLSFAEREARARSKRKKPAGKR